MFNGLTLFAIILMVAAICVWLIIEERNEMKSYCKHCNERIIWKHGDWAARVALDWHRNYGDPYTCKTTGQGHEER